MQHSDETTSTNTAGNVSTGSITSIASEINRFTQGIKGISAEYEQASKNLRALITRLRSTTKNNKRNEDLKLKKLKNFNKVLNYKILSALPVMGACLAATSQTSSAMLRSALSSFSRILQTSTKNTITTTSPQTVKYLYRSGAKVSVLDSNPLKIQNPNSSFSIKNSSINPPNASTNIYRNNRTLSVLGNYILQNNNGNYTPLNLTSKLTPYSQANTQQPISNKTSISNINLRLLQHHLHLIRIIILIHQKLIKLGILLGNALTPILELSARTTFYGIKNNSNDISSLINSNKSYKNESSKWGNILSTAILARLQVDALNNNQNSTTFSKRID